jgi:hypothetical protein
VEFTAEEMEPEIPVRRDAQEPLADVTKEAASDMVLGAKL